MDLFEDNFFNEKDLMDDLRHAGIVADEPFYSIIKKYQQYLEIKPKMLKIFNYNDCIPQSLVNKIENINDLKNLLQDLYNLPHFPNIYQDRRSYGKKLYELFHKYSIYF